MAAWFYNDEMKSPKIKSWKNYCLVGFELLLKSDHFTYGGNKFWSQPFFSSKWSWVDNELRTAYLGMGVEFYLKGVYLKNGFSIHQINQQFIYPENIVKIDKNKLFKQQNITFSQMITEDNLNLVIDQKEIKKVRFGLLIIQGWRNAVLHSVRLTKIVSGKELSLVTDSVNILHNLLIKLEKQLMGSVNKVASPWLKDRYPDGKFMKKEPLSKKMISLSPPPLGEIVKLLKKYDPDFLNKDMNLS